MQEALAWGVIGWPVRKKWMSDKILVAGCSRCILIGWSGNKYYVAFNQALFRATCDIIGLVYLAAIHTKSQSKVFQSVNNKIVNSDVYFGLSCCLSIQTVQAIQTAGSYQEKLFISFDSVFLCCMFYIAVDVVLNRFLKT